MDPSTFKKESHMTMWNQTRGILKNDEVLKIFILHHITIGQIKIEEIIDRRVQ